MPLQILDTVTSTMDVARENVLSGRVRFEASDRARLLGVLAREQTAGRGQRGRAWYAAPGESLCVTYYYRRGLTDPLHAAPLSFLAGVAVADTVSRLVRGMRWPIRRESHSETSPPSLPDVGLKWPNDVLLNGKKVGGILIEMVKAPDEAWVALIGVGLNLTMRALPPEIADYATSLALEGVTPCAPETLGERIGRALHRQADILRDRGFPALLQRWRAYDRTAGRRYRTETEAATLLGVAEGIDDTGALLLRLDDGTLFPVTTAASLRETGN